jgi:hypothetical protein
MKAISGFSLGFVLLLSFFKLGQAMKDDDPWLKL